MSSPRRGNAHGSAGREPSAFLANCLGDQIGRAGIQSAMTADGDAKHRSPPGRVERGFPPRRAGAHAASGGGLTAGVSVISTVFPPKLMPEMSKLDSAPIWPLYPWPVNQIPVPLKEFPAAAEELLM